MIKLIGIFGERVRQRVLGFPQNNLMTFEAMEKASEYLFPTHPRVDFVPQKTDKFVDFTVEELKSASNKLKLNKAPGPGQIPNVVIKMVAEKKPKIVLETLNKLAVNGVFPIVWKKAKLILLRKGNKPTDQPSSYRPICLLDAEGKLYEQLLLGRINEELRKKGDLAKNEFGFRKGRQSIDAIRKTLSHAEDAARFSTNSKRLCAAITLDLKNTFNSASWQIILDELRMRKFDESIITIIALYLSEREIIIETELGKKEIEITSGVPQGSVLRPTLWNIQYDELLKINFPEGVYVVGFADDVFIVVVATSEKILMEKAETTVTRVVE